MHALTVTLGPHSYPLRPGTNARRLESRIVAAMRRGAGIVRLRLATGDEVDAVVTPGLPVLVQRAREIAPTAPAEPRVDWPEIDCGQF